MRHMASRSVMVVPPPQQGHRRYQENFMKTSTLLAALLALCIASSANAQTTTTASLAWDIETRTPAQVNAWQRVIQIDNVTVTAAPTCVAATFASGAGSTCSVPSNGLATGPHSASVQYSDGNITVKLSQANLSTAAGPNSPVMPGSLRITTTTTTTVTATTP
jgi:hypothetical protein